MNTTRRKAWAFGLFLVFTLVAGAATVDRVDRLGRAADLSREDPFILTTDLLEAHDAAYHLQAAMHQAVMAGDAGALAHLDPVIAAEEGRLDDALAAAIRPHVDRPSVLAPLFNDLADWQETRSRVRDLAEDGRWVEAHSLLGGDGEENLGKLHDSFNRILDAERLRAARLAENTRVAEWEALVAAMALALAAGGALAGFVVGFSLFTRTHRPLMRLRNALLALAEGDTAVAIPHCHKAGTIGTMARAIATFQRSLVERDAATLALRQSEEHLHQAVAEARRADDCKGRFLASASHDLRQPMQALRLFLDVLDSRLSQTGDRLVLSGAMKALAAGEDLLRDYLDVSVLEAGMVQPTRADIAINDLLAELVAECTPAAAVKGLRLRMVRCPWRIDSDLHLLRRLLRNLLVNATRYTDQGGIVIGCRLRGDDLRIEVWDSGIGIAADKLAAVFEDFFQIGNPERDRTKGLGLGLSVVDRIARLLDHRIEVASRPGKGSMFAITVPLVDALAATRAAA